jgi:hypothetical protein
MVILDNTFNVAKRGAGKGPAVHQRLVGPEAAIRNKQPAMSFLGNIRSIGISLGQSGIAAAHPIRIGKSRS